MVRQKKSQQLPLVRRVVSLRRLKKQMAESLPSSLKTVQLILQEPDELPSEEFLAKSDLWGRLLAAEIKTGETP